VAYWSTSSSLPN